LIEVLSFNAADEFLTMSIFLNSCPDVEAVIPITSPVPEKDTLSKEQVEPVPGVSTQIPSRPGTLFTHELNSSPLVMQQL
jgi:hypothetical protein